MTDTYPLPSYAASIWIAGDKIMLAIPATTGLSGHTIPFPNSEKGLTVLLTLLRDRERDRHGGLGTRASPPKAQIESVLSKDVKYKAWLKEMGTNAAEKAEAQDFLKELGI